MIIDTPPTAAAGSMEIEEVAVVLLFPVFVLVPVALPVVVSASVAVSVLVPVLVPVVPEAVSEAVEAAVVCSEVSAAVVSVVSEIWVSIDYNNIKTIFHYLLAYPRSHQEVRKAAMAKPRILSPTTKQCKAHSGR